MIHASVKRAMDIAGGFLGLVLFSPVMLWIALKLRSEMGRALFAQERAGMDGRSFRLCKFRSMTDERDERGNILPDEARITNFGRWLRSTSLDELPQFWNVLKGDMSLVGPRPLLMDYVPLYSDAQRARLSVKPGITGWAQINGRNSISWPEKFALDAWYVEHESLILDMRIILITIKKALKREGISAAGEATMPRFTGER
ncbi:MAG: sugar transferase [Synergistaceae bacterium]|jgi:lipopolysaccharide/colanic/teichoic acid biosynthesis glycosyltransferase|nr:sugar transferase [Synergistaceae bacterium]